MRTRNASRANAAALAKPIRGRATSAARLSDIEAHLRIEEAGGHVDDEVEDEIEERHGEDEALHRGKVRSQHRVDGVGADARPAEDLLDQDADAEHVGENHPGGIEYRHDGAAKGVDEENLPSRQPGRIGGPYEIVG